MKHRTVDELVNIISAGAGIYIDGSKYSVEELIRIANAANGSSHIFITDTKKIPSDQLTLIGNAGRGSIIFQD